MQYKLKTTTKIRNYFMTFFVIFFCLVVPTASSSDCFWLDNALEGPLHKKECILEKEDITDTNALRPIDFWKRVGRYANRPFSIQPDDRIMAHRLFQIYFFANFPSVLLNSNIANSFEDSAAYLLSLSGFKKSGLLGQTISKINGDYVVAYDIPFEPILTGHGKFSAKYYPRRMGDHALTFLKGYYLTNDINYKNRFFDMNNYLIYSQFKQDGSNEFIQRFCRKGNANCPPVDKKNDVSAWTGGFDFNFDFEWRDAYGYKWQLHEPDHHVNSINAVSLVKGFELSRDKKYLNAAYNFVYNMIPRYGYHTGIWNNQRYYWTEYNPSGKTNPTDDAVDNVQSLVAHSVAMVGFYTKNMAMLEYARGLLWYNLREFKMDSRWFYDGAENKMNARRAISHDGAVLKSAIETLPYLVKSGMNVKDLVEGYYDAFMQYLYYDDPNISKIVWRTGSFRADASKDAPANRAQLSPFRHVRAWKTFAQMPKINQEVRVTYFFQITDKDIIKKHDKISLQDRLLYELPPGTRVSFSRYSPVTELEENVATLSIKEKTTKIDDVFLQYSQIQIGDIMSVSFNWTPISENSLSYKMSKFALFFQTDQLRQKQVPSSLVAVDPATGGITELFKIFHKKYFLPREINLQ